MKKFVKVLGLAVLALCFSVALMACGNDDAAENGTYEVTMGEGEYATVMTLELKNGNVTQTMKVGENTTTVKGTYTIDGETDYGHRRRNKLFRHYQRRQNHVYDGRSGRSDACQKVNVCRKRHTREKGMHDSLGIPFFVETV